jgi:hypothetical protein
VAALEILVTDGVAIVQPDDLALSLNLKSQVVIRIRH